MIVKSILNNYQMGSYSHNVLSMNIISEQRIDKYHTEVIWKVNKSEYELLKRAISKKLTILED